jgi:basic amino acid/polyamine antiporter, APA family
MPEELKKSLGFFAVCALILTSMIGTSLFFGISTGARYAGTASLFAWLLIGLLTIYVAACFGELISMFPSSGGVYEFTKQAYGRFPSFLIGWMTWIIANIGSAVLVVAALDFLVPGSGSVFIGGFAVSKAIVKLSAALAIIFFFNYITYRGVQASGTLLLVFALVMLVLLVLLIVPGATHIHPDYYRVAQPITPAILFIVMFFLVESFFGWEAASFLAEETKDAERTIPRALLWASGIVALLGLLLATVTFGVLPMDVIADNPNPVLALAFAILPQAVPFIIVGVFLTFIGGVISNTISSPRLLFALARDKLFIEQCTRVHPVHRTPVNAIIFQTIVTVIVVVVAFGEYSVLLSMLVPIALLMYSVVLLSIPRLRKIKPHHPRPFKVWFGDVGPIVVALFYLCIVVSWFVLTPHAISTLLLIGGFIALSLPIYFFLTMVYNPDAIISISNAAARVNYLLEDVLFPKAVRVEVLDLFRGHFKGKRVVEFGSGVGTFTLHLADEVGPQGRVTAIDFSESNLAILRKRAQRKDAPIELIYDEHQVNRLHPDITRADIIYSVGFLGYVQDLNKVLREMHGVLVPGGKICFVEYTNFFKVLPDPAIVSDVEKLQKQFADAGFSVAIKKRQGFLWNYLIIHGIKTDKKVPFV